MHLYQYINYLPDVNELKSFILNTNYQIYTKVNKKSFNWTNEIFKNMNDPKLGGIG